MSAVTLKVGQWFPAGTSVGAYQRSAWQGVSTQNPDPAAPAGAAIETQPVGADGSLTFSSLADGSYFAYAQVSGRHTIVGFAAGSVSPSQPSFAAGFRGGQIPVWDPAQKKFVPQTSTSDAKRAALLPSGAIDETMPRIGNVSNIAGMLVSGTLRLQAAVLLPRGRAVSSITLYSGSTAADTPLNQWFTLIRMSDLAVLAKTVDDTTAAWPANTKKTLALPGVLLPEQDEVCYVGACVVATVPPSLMGNSLPSGALDEAPRVCGPSTAGLTNPASLGAAAAAPAANTQQFYAYVS